MQQSFSFSLSCPGHLSDRYRVLDFLRGVPFKDEQLRKIDRREQFARKYFMRFKPAPRRAASTPCRALPSSTRSNSLSALAEGQPVFSTGAGRFTIGIHQRGVPGRPIISIFKENVRGLPSAVAQGLATHLSRSVQNGFN